MTKKEMCEEMRFLVRSYDDGLNPELIVRMLNTLEKNKNKTVAEYVKEAYHVDKE